MQEPSNKVLPISHAGLLIKMSLACHCLGGVPLVALHAAGVYISTRGPSEGDSERSAMAAGQGGATAIRRLLKRHDDAEAATRWA